MFPQILDLFHIIIHIANLIPSALENLQVFAGWTSDKLGKCLETLLTNIIRTNIDVSDIALGSQCQTDHVHGFGTEFIVLEH